MFLTDKTQLILLLTLGATPIAAMLTANGRVVSASAVMASLLVAVGYFTWGLA